MLTKKQFKLLQVKLNQISNKELVDFILNHEKISQKELLDLTRHNLEFIPLSIFITKLTPLEAITYFLKNERKRKTKEIAIMLNKKPSSISEAYRNSIKKQPIPQFKKDTSYINLSEFQDNPKFSILEVIVNYLRNQNYSFTKIAKLLKRNPKTIWTIYQRAKKKNEE